MTDICERLREFPAFFRNGAHWLQSTNKEPLCLEAADEIERLRAQVAEGRELLTDALKFINQYPEWAGCPPRIGHFDLRNDIDAYLAKTATNAE